MGIDTVILAAIAVVLLARLWFVLGRRSDSDPQRPNPFVVPAPGAMDAQKPPQPQVTPPSVAAPGDVPVKAAPIFRLAPTSVAGGLEQIKAADAAFDERDFLRDAKSTFTAIVGDFAKGDLSREAPRLGPKVRPQFEAAIAARHAAQQSLECRISTIRDAETVNASVTDNEARIGVRFVSEQENILRDAGGQVIGGKPGQLEEIIDLWTFAKDLKASETPWILVETRA